MSKIDRFFYKHNIRNLSLYIVISYAFGYILNAVNPVFLDYLTLNPERILHGHIWRLVTWVLVPPDTSNIFLVLIACLFYYSIGTALENVWGAAQYNKYIFSGLLFTLIGAFAATLLAVPVYGTSMYIAGQLTARYFTTNFVMMSIFLGYAATFPEATVLFMFIIPLKVKWLGIAYAVITVWEVVEYALQGNLFGILAIVASLLNFLIFFFRNRDLKRFSPKEIKRRSSFKKSVNRNSSPFGNAGSSQGRSASQRSTGGQPVNGSFRKMEPSHHKCCICGRTDISNPELEFRYCSKCQGDYEFCQDHLFTHVHAVNGNAPYIIPQQKGGTGDGQQ